MRSVDENKAALLELGSSPAMWRMLETMPWPAPEELSMWLIHDFPRLLHDQNPSEALEFKRQFVAWFEINAPFFRAISLPVAELPLWWLTQVPDILQWSSIRAIASRMSNTPTIDELNDWGSILNSKGTDHFTARRYQIVRHACPSNEAKYVTLAVYAAHGGDLDHPLVEEHTPPLWIQHTQTVSSMDLPPSTQIEHALLVIQQWAPTSSSQPLELELPGVSDSSGFV